VSLSFVFLGLSITSSWGNGHATTYRGLLRELAARGHQVTFLERDVPYYASNRDLRALPWGTAALYGSLAELDARFSSTVRDADVVVIGSYVPDGCEVIRWALRKRRGLLAFYDIDTPVTLAKLAAGDHQYLAADLVPRFDLYLSFTGGPVLRRLERRYGAAQARTLYCAADETQYYPEPTETRWDVGYLGTYSADRQAVLDELLVRPALAWPEGRFIVAGPMYPATTTWPLNVVRIDHLAPTEHRAFYNAQRWSLNATRRDMVAAGWSPSVRLFEAAACGTPVVSDVWPGIESIFEPEREILLARTAREALEHVRDVDDERRARIGEAARRRVLAEHTAAHRAEALERYARELLDARASRQSVAAVAGTRG
jgi:spore maturation protein CgeB